MSPMPTIKNYDFDLKKCIIGLKKGPSLMYFDVILTTCRGPTPFQLPYCP